MMIEERLKEVAELRKIVSMALDTKRQLLDFWQKEHGAFLANLAEGQKTLEEAEQGLRAMALAGYDSDSNPKPAPGLQIKLFRVLEYNPAEAFSWALEHKICLSLDKKAFDNLAKTSETKPEFVVVIEEPRVMIATDLSAYLKEEEK